MGRRGSHGNSLGSQSEWVWIISVNGSHLGNGLDLGIGLRRESHHFIRLYLFDRAKSFTQFLNGFEGLEGAVSGFNNSSSFIGNIHAFVGTGIISW